MSFFYSLHYELEHECMIIPTNKWRTYMASFAYLSNVPKIDKEGTWPGINGHKGTRLVHEFKTANISIILKLYLLILRWQDHPLNNSLANPTLLANIRPKSMARSCIAWVYISIISLAIRAVQLESINVIKL